MDIKGNLVKRIEISEDKYYSDRARFVVIELKDGRTISIQPAMGSTIIINKTHLGQ